MVCYNYEGAVMLPILLSVVVISFSGVMMPGPMFAVALAKSYKSPFAGVQIALGHAVIEVPLILLINGAKPPHPPMKYCIIILITFEMTQ